MRPACSSAGPRAMPWWHCADVMAESIAEKLASAAARAEVPPAMREVAERLLVDVAGLCVAARKADYVRASLASWEATGRCTAIGHERALDAAGGAARPRTRAPGGGVRGPLR